MNAEMGQSEDFQHTPVLAEEIVCYLGKCRHLERLIDGTLGNGGHSALLLQRYPQLQLLGIDRDEEARQRAAVNLQFAADRIHLYCGNYSRMLEFAAQTDWRQVDAILLDIGVSSPQIDDPRRGFSLRYDGPLDMRMDKSSPLTASRLLNRASETELADIFYQYGEIKRSRRLAAAVVARRVHQPFAATLDFAGFCEKVLGKSRPGKLPTPTKCFQALRIAVNDELNELSAGLTAAMKLLSPGGILAVISFHSLEDRIVKRFFMEAAKNCICPPGMPVCRCQHQAELKIITRRPIMASAQECRLNPRAACAKLRVAEKLPAETPGVYR